jgi:hypothetical protein
MSSNQLCVVSYIDDGAIYYARYVVTDGVMTVSGQFGSRTAKVGTKNHQAVARLMVQGMICASSSGPAVSSSQLLELSVVDPW